MPHSPPITSHALRTNGHDACRAREGRHVHGARHTGDAPGEAVAVVRAGRPLDDVVPGAAGVDEGLALYVIQQRGVYEPPGPALVRRRPVVALQDGW